MSRNNVFKLSGNMALGGGDNYPSNDFENIKNSLKLLKSKQTQKQSTGPLQSAVTHPYTQNIYSGSYSSNAPQRQPPVSKSKHRYIQISEHKTTRTTTISRANLPETKQIHTKMFTSLQNIIILPMTIPQSNAIMQDKSTNSISPSRGPKCSLKLKSKSIDSNRNTNLKEGSKEEEILLRKRISRSLTEKIGFRYKNTILRNLYNAARVVEGNLILIVSISMKQFVGRFSNKKGKSSMLKTKD